jgi:toxin YoeB
VRLTFQEDGWDDYLYWQAHDKQRLNKLDGLLRECLRTPYSGTGKPEPLRGEFSGWWSRRIDDEHRLIYRVADDALLIAQCRYHYVR